MKPLALLDLQTILTQLYTDSAYRARFFRDRVGACADVPLTERERAHLCALDPDQVERFARSLRQKRCASARDLLPVTARTMGARFAESFFRYCDAHPGASRPPDEAAAFAAFLGGSSVGGPPYLRDVIACERLRLDVLHRSAAEAALEGSQPSCPGFSLDSPVSPPRVDGENVRPRFTSRARIAFFAYDMEVLYPRLASGDEAEAQPDPSIILIGRVQGAMIARLKRLSPTTEQFLRLCDGTRPLSAIVDEVAADLRLDEQDRHKLGAECARFLTPLVESNLIHLEP